jgi:hypothetical protein
MNDSKQQATEAFLLKTAIKECLQISKLKHPDFIYLAKINLAATTKIVGNKVIFQSLLFKLLRNARYSYQPQYSKNRVILIIALLKTQQQFSLSISNGGVGLSLLEKKLSQSRFFFLREGSNLQHINKISQIIKKYFHGQLDIISKKHKGQTISCLFPLNQ